MKLSEVNLSKIGAACLCVNGIILLFYGLFVPTFVRGVHWLITLAVILFIVAIPAIYLSIRRIERVVAKVVAALFVFAMAAIIVSDLLFALSLLTTFSHDLTYFLGNAVLVIGVLVVGFVALKGVFYKWVAYLGIVTGVVGLESVLAIAANLPQAAGPLSTFSLVLLGLWSLAVGFNIHKLAKSRFSKPRRQARRST
jgi:hypothetical protein